MLYLFLIESTYALFTLRFFGYLMDLMYVPWHKGPFQLMGPSYDTSAESWPQGARTTTQAARRGLHENDTWDTRDNTIKFQSMYCLLGVMSVRII